MKFACYESGNGPKLGVVSSDGSLVDLSRSLGANDGIAGDAARAGDIGILIEGYKESGDAIRNALYGALSAEPRATIDTTKAIWLPPVRRPSKICCLALNNSANADRIMSGPQHPAIFLKAANALIGHRGRVRIRPEYGRVHPEPELAVVISKTASNVDAADAYDHVFGYTIHNDITSPKMRAEDTFHYRAIHPSEEGESAIKYVDTYTTYPGRYKCSDTFSPIGPWVVTRDEIPDPHNLAVILRRGTEIITQDSTANLTYKIPETLAFVTKYMTLMPGDIVSMGTALKRTTERSVAVQNIDLQTTDEPISISIDGLGTLECGVERI